MAFFSKKKDIEKKETVKTVKDSSGKNKKSKSSEKKIAKTFSKDLTWVLKGPRITEKGAAIAEMKNAYVFDIDQKATKTDVKNVIEMIYKIVPKKVTITKVPSKKVQVRGKRGKFGIKSGGKKAYVYLNKGDKIEFV